MVRSQLTEAEFHAGVYAWLDETLRHNAAQHMGPRLLSPSCPESSAGRLRAAHRSTGPGGEDSLRLQNPKDRVFTAQLSGMIWQHTPETGWGESTKRQQRH